MPPTPPSSGSLANASSPFGATTESRKGERWLRTHQEDLCQALNVHSTQKYQSDEGPGPEAILDLLRDESSDRNADRTRFLDGLIFNWAIGGTDGHAKNYSVLLRGGQTNLRSALRHDDRDPVLVGARGDESAHRHEGQRGVHPR